MNDDFPTSDIKPSPRVPTIHINLVEYLKLNYPNHKARFGADTLELAQKLHDEINFNVIFDHFQEILMEW